MAAIDIERPDKASGVHGRLEMHDGLRVLRVWGTPAERGYAHGYLLATDIQKMMNQEFAARFADEPKLLGRARAALPLLINYPEEVAAELEGLWQGFLARKPDRKMPALKRDFDKTDLRVANALDVFGLMGCSSFTVWGEQAVGGGVLTARNFDWPLTGDHMLDQTLLVVQMPKGETPTASISWPGYIGTVTGISKDGVAAYLHVGSAKFSLPQPFSWPSATAARKILEAREQDAARLEKAREFLDHTSPPVGFLTHVVLPREQKAGPPAALFETNASGPIQGEAAKGPVVVTNHFQTRKDGREASGDSMGREKTVHEGIAGCIKIGDHSIDPAEAWQILASVEASGGHRFGTLHSLVFRHEPWFFEVRVADNAADGLTGAPSSSRRHRLTREQVFGVAVASGK